MHKDSGLDRAKSSQPSRTSNVWDELRRLPKRWQAVFSIITSAYIAYYVPLIPFALFDAWRDMIAYPLLAISGLIVFGIMGITITLSGRPRSAGNALGGAWFVVVSLFIYFTEAKSPGLLLAYVTPCLASVLQGLFLEWLYTRLQFQLPSNDEFRPWRSLGPRMAMIWGRSESCFGENRDGSKRLDEASVSELESALERARQREQGRFED